MVVFGGDRVMGVAAANYTVQAAAIYLTLALVLRLFQDNKRGIALAVLFFCTCIAQACLTYCLKLPDALRENMRRIPDAFFWLTLRNALFAPFIAWLGS